jgi:hypothetical protein
MIRKLLIIIISQLFTANGLMAQDILFRKTGEKIPCTITHEDSSNVYFDVVRNEILRSTFLSKMDIDSIFYNKKKNKSPWLKDNDIASLGIGAGFDFGGLGGNLLIYPQRKIGLFVGAGYAIAGMGINAGIKLRFITQKTKTKVVPFAIGMYGYNVGVIVRTQSKYNTLFYGATAGLGMDLRFKPKSDGYWTLGVLIPFIKREAYTYVNELKSKGIIFRQEPAPFGIMVGYRLIINFWQKKRESN